MAERDQFETMYKATAPWDIPGPQPALVTLQQAGEIRGSVLDAGCGTGEHALYLASQGHEVWGIDFVPLAIERAKAKGTVAAGFEGPIPSGQRPGVGKARPSI